VTGLMAWLLSRHTSCAVVKWIDGRGVHGIASWAELLRDDSVVGVIVRLWRFYLHADCLLAGGRRRRVGAANARARRLQKSSPLALIDEEQSPERPRTGRAAPKVEQQSANPSSPPSYRS